MKQLSSFTRAIFLASLMSAATFAAHADDVLIGGRAIENDVTTKVLAVDATNHVVTVEDAKGDPISIQLSDKAKDLGNLKVGDTVKVHVSRSVAAVLEKNVVAAPGVSEEKGVIRATPNNPNPGGEAFRQIKITSKITKINLKTHEVTLLPPEGMEKVVKVEDKDLQARMKNLKVGDMVTVTYTDLLKITTAH
ncbi:hypothetical protein [Pseudomonas akapageensis]|uniref:hypothetical protein n=1 Tax=Pseudomonas akapageensis TaxID=2609961 RepID=UPI001409795E|nr:hypothetical protein [Pseudomonas akapageensis]